ncbi:hypothetical protein QVD17_14645 [Tagetes erecta]|uniref:Mitotic-spindle organizing protein 1 n=1 Tax=Tagetes erecta TaxID=13708 RepID=A0AAD8KQU5_TARER|nr:hypothetical protein QVD17_14645 [Tagetes erecta]
MLRGANSMYKREGHKQRCVGMDEDAAAARESVELVFQMSNILETGLDRHTLSVLIALCDLALNPEALAAVVKELRKDPPSTSPTNSC